MPMRVESEVYVIDVYTKSDCSAPRYRIFEGWAREGDKQAIC